MHVVIGILLLAGIALVSWALSANATYQSAGADLIAYKLKASAHPYRGSIMGLSGGYARPLVAGDTFIGMSSGEVNNTGADGAMDVEVETRGIYLLTGSGFAATDVGVAVYASDDATVTKTVGSNSAIGTIVRYVSATQVWVKIAPAA